MSAAKKPAPAGVSGDPGSTQEDLNLRYTAHQVHTLAQIVFQRLGGNGAGAAPWMSQPAFGQPYPAAATGFGGMMPQGPSAGSVLAPAMPPALFYWYP